MADNLAVFQKAEVINAITKALAPYFVSKSELDTAVANLRGRALAATEGNGSGFSISRAIRGLSATRGNVISGESRDGDIAYLNQQLKPVSERALSTGSQPGSYIVPTFQSSEIIQILTDGGALRRLKPRTWPMSNLQTLTVPTETGFPTLDWVGENTSQSASDPNLGQISLNLKTCRGLVAVPNELIAVSSPAVDFVINELLGLALAEKEDTAFFATTSQSGGPTSVYAASDTTVRNCFSANGGPVRYIDVLNQLGDLYTAKARPPFVYAMHPRSFFGSNGVLNCLDLNSRPIVQEHAANTGVQFSIFGYPVFLSALIPVNQAIGSGTNLSAIYLLNPRAIQVGESDIEIATSSERYFELNQTAIRLVRRLDFAYAPAAAVHILKGVA